MNITERVAQLLHQACPLLPFTNYIPCYYLYHTLNPESPQLAKSGSTFVRSPPFWLDWSLLRRLPKTCVRPCLGFGLSCLGHYGSIEFQAPDFGFGSSAIPVFVTINDKSPKTDFLRAPCTLGKACLPNRSRSSTSLILHFPSG